MFHFSSTWDQLILMSVGLATRLAYLDEPSAVVFDELHYGRLASLYVNRTFYFEPNPPLFVMLIALVGYLAGFDGIWTSTHIGEVYSKSTLIWYLRLIPSLCGSFTIVITYKLMLELRYSRWTCLLAALLVTLENGFLVQSRFILMEAPFVFCLLMVLWMEIKFSKANETRQWSVVWWTYLIFLGLAMTSAMCIKYIGFTTVVFALIQVGIKLWSMLPRLSGWEILKHVAARLLFLVVFPIVLYVGLFYIHLIILNKSGPHDARFTSAFQASLKGGLSEITRGQPLVVSYGSQITLRRTHGTPCWLHSHDLLYPQQYLDVRGSSMQQQVTCNTLKGVDNWWIVKNPNSSSLIVDTIQPVKHQDIIQLAHGMTGRLLNSHDVAAPISPHYQEVSCYIEYEMSLPEFSHWQVIILDAKNSKSVWKSVTSLVHLVHVNTSQALRTSGQRLGAWGFDQLEIVTDRLLNQPHTVWNVEEHKYTLDDAMENTNLVEDSFPLGFWAKFLELQVEMILMKESEVNVEHVYSSDSWQWPLLSQNIIYWFDPQNNSQIHLVGNPIVWCTASFGVLLYTCLMIFYLLRRQRAYFDLPQEVWEQFSYSSGVLFLCYLVNYIPFLLTERTTFLYQYLPALLFKVLLLAAVLEHVGKLIAIGNAVFVTPYLLLVAVWLSVVCFTFVLFGAVTYGRTSVSEALVGQLKWFDSWDFIV